MFIITQHRTEFVFDTVDAISINVLKVVEIVISLIDALKIVRSVDFIISTSPIAS